ncbi:MAG: sorbosone dehydrogenase family protein [Gemmatimonadota bacterium]
MVALPLLFALAFQQLPEPFETPWTRAIPSVVERPEGAAPTVPEGFEVSTFAEGLADPRRMELAPNGDVFVAESRAGEIVVLIDEDGDGTAERRETFATGLDRPFGLAFQAGFLYVGNNGAVVRFPYVSGQRAAKGEPEHVVELPSSSDAIDHDTAERLGIDVSRTRGFNHWTRNLIFGPGGQKMYVAVGSATNAMPGTDPRRAAINEYDPDGSSHRVLAGGLRNPVALAFQPESGVLWTAVHERDHLGDELAPDFVTSVVDGGFYGWPYAYIGPNPEPILNGARPDLVETTLVPDVLLPAHAAPMGMVFYTGSQFPPAYRNGAFIALHGSINRRDLVGYSVVWIPFESGVPSGPPRDFLTGFIVRNDDEKEVWGRPVGVLQTADGALLVSDDAGNRIFRIAYRGPLGPRAEEVTP